ncbi:hypothetical protein OGR47_01695 [Methylocystis sp. MJC1]|jgi:hypothetical protein|uniref:hypothetical protein n=1 Tax=Methylocystis sp. MJC1 TaxID=2654282 RepID=UPI0013EDE7FD|nr:hypothetical protein [Methylocystis sp. MJC1]KAF2990613.1 hypothetical protein MJC1_02376 [Methylocystis sp. MJC1]MBU6525726.1 hypothetical protein [Methylocystis sp. MJC1]UZX12197.1 hypothetical protein OGR47_01695 [Methylocystis sp. MJC1]
MKKSALQIAEPRQDVSSELVLPSLSECRQLSRDLRDQLEIVEQKVQMAHDRLIADAHRDGVNESLVHGASATVVLSIAASMMEFSSYRMGRPLDETAFIAAARVAAQISRERSGAKCEPLVSSTVDSVLAAAKRDS